jgi:hypothetical protein
LITVSDPSAKKNFDSETFAKKGAHLVNKRGYSRNRAAEKLGRHAADLTHHCRKWGIELRTFKSRRIWDYAEVLKTSLDLINVQGYRLKDAAKQIGATPPVLINVFKKRGYKYDAKTIKIRKVKS